MFWLQWSSRYSTKLTDSALFSDTPQIDNFLREKLVWNVVNSSNFSKSLKNPLHESSQDATRKTQRTGPKQQVFVNFMHSKGTQFTNIRKIVQFALLKYANYRWNLMNAREKSHPSLQNFVINLNFKYNCFTLNNGEKILPWSHGGIYIPR